MRRVAFPRSSAGPLARALLFIGAGWLVGCASDETLTPSGLDRSYFESCVEPIIVKRCGMLACHGNADRFFRVFSRNRFRIDQSPSKRDALITEEERTFNYEAAVSMIDSEQVEKSLLVRKPLDADLGGYVHDGATQFGQGDVFVDEADPELRALKSWTRGEKGTDCR